MANDVEDSGIVGGVETDADGVRHVNTYAVLATIAQAVNELKHEVRGGGKQQGLSA